nr:MAG TPA: hypothetical protein [Caudoviricetes sp.]
MWISSFVAGVESPSSKWERISSENSIKALFNFLSNS